MNQYHSYLKRLNFKALTERIQTYRSLDFTELDTNGLLNALLDVLCVSDGKKSYHVLPTAGGPQDSGKRFYRARKIGREENPLTPKKIRIESDAWNPPQDYAGAGRVNRKGNSLLYTAEDPSTAVIETRISDHEPFAMIVYESIKPLHIRAIAPPNNIENTLSADELEKSRMLFDFLLSEFRRDSGADGSHVYRASELIADSFFPNPEADAWWYESTLIRNQYNYCFKPERAKEKLKIIGITIASSVRYTNSMIFNFLSTCENMNNGGEFRFEEPHNIQNLFPEFF